MLEAKPSAQLRHTGEKALVTFVQDGDTASLKRSDGSSVNCRIDTIDAPETGHARVGKVGQDYGYQAKKTLQQMIENKEVTLRIVRPEAQGSHGRAICQIEISGQNIDQKMVQAGAAWVYRRYSNDPGLIAAEDEAKKQKRGLWASPNPVNPELFRRSQ